MAWRFGRFENSIIVVRTREQNLGLRRTNPMFRRLKPSFNPQVHLNASPLQSESVSTRDWSLFLNWRGEQPLTLCTQVLDPIRNSILASLIVKVKEIGVLVTSQRSFEGKLGSTRNLISHVTHLLASKWLGNSPRRHRTSWNQNFPVITSKCAPPTSSTHYWLRHQQPQS